MLRRFRQATGLRNAILGVALLLGQWLFLAHAIEHPALSPEQACQICVHGQGLDSGALAPTVVALPSFDPAAFVTVALPSAVATSFRTLYRARAPPAVLA